MLGRTRATFAPAARFAIDSDLSDARGLKRVLGQEHRQLVVCGSSHRGDTGKVSIGHATRQLIEDGHYALGHRRAQTERPRGARALRASASATTAGPERAPPSAWAAAIAEGCGARLTVRGVINDHVPALGWPRLSVEPFRECWNEVMDEEAQALHTSIEATAAGLSVPVTATVDRDVPAASLLDLSAASDLLVIGSRRWGPMARLLLGGTARRSSTARSARC